MHIVYPHKLLFCLLFIGIWTHEYYHNNIQLVSNTQQSKKEPFRFFMKQCVYMGKYIYTLFCFSVLVIQTSFAWNKTLYDFGSHFPFALLYTILPLQYAVACYYIRHPHFLSFFQRSSTKLFNSIPNEYLILISQPIMFITTTCIYAEVRYFDITHTVWHSYVDPHWVYPLEIFTWFVGGNILFFNVCIFILVFCIHLKELYNIAYKIHYPVHQTILGDTVYKIVKLKIATYKYFQEDKYKYKEFDAEDEVEISEIFYKIANLKFNIGTSILLFQKVYTFITILTIIAFAFQVQHMQYVNIQLDNFKLVVMIIFCAIQLIFIIIIVAISRCRLVLLHAIESPIFIYGFLKHIHVKYQNNIQNKTTRSILHNPVIDCGHQQMRISKQTRMDQLHTTRGARNDIHDMQNPNRIPDHNLSNEWIMLHRLLSSRWATFSLCGLSFEDGTAIQKAIALSAGIVVLTRIMNGVL